MREYLFRHRYAICCVFSAVASLLNFVNPLLAGALINRTITSFSLPVIAPFIVGMAMVNGLRIVLRSIVAYYLKGHHRAPIIWLQRRIGRWLWWLEPVLHGWGLPGMAFKKLNRYLASRKLTTPFPSLRSSKPIKKHRLTLSISSSIIYLIADTIVTFLSGLLYFYTHSYFISLLPVLLPAAAAVPWLRKKSTRIKKTTLILSR